MFSLRGAIEAMLLIALKPCIEDLAYETDPWYVGQILSLEAKNAKFRQSRVEKASCRFIIWRSSHKH